MIAFKMNRFAAILLSVWTGLAGALNAHAQSVTTIVSFNITNGANPIAGLTLGPDGKFYGTTSGGGANNNGTVFKVTTNGTLTTLANFNSTNGTDPWAGLTLGPDGNFYGTALAGGNTGFQGAQGGTVYSVTTNGTLTTLVYFNFTNGTQPRAGLTLGPDGNFYGTTAHGGNTNIYSSTGSGTVYKVTTNGTLTTLVKFDGTNGDAVYAGLTLGSGGNFYGTAFGGGPNGYGTIFKITTNGTLTTLANCDHSPSQTGPEPGYAPNAGLTLGPDGNFYGTTVLGGNTGGNFSGGTVFKVTTNGTLTTLVIFNGTNGAQPSASLTWGPDGNFYGTTSGGISSDGTVFKVTTNGTLTSLVSFNGTNGADPQASLTLGPDGNFYGTTYQGGSAGYGTIFRLNLPPDFITAPSNQSTVIGSSATFNCQPFGTAPFAYQWLSNGVAIARATNASLRIGPALPSQVGNYQLVVTNSYGSITSQVASLSLLLKPNVYSVSNAGAGNFNVYLASIPNTTNRLWATTNITLNQWQVIATNITDSNGLAQFLDTNTAGMPQKFYRLSYP